MENQPKKPLHFEVWVCWRCHPLMFHMYLHLKTCVSIVTCNETMKQKTRNIFRSMWRSPECSMFPWIQSTEHSGSHNRRGDPPPRLDSEKWGGQVSNSWLQDRWQTCGWIFLQHQYLQCWQLIAAISLTALTGQWPGELWTLSLWPTSVPNGHAASTLLWSVVCSLRYTNWLSEWVILLFWEGLDYEKSFVLKNEIREGVLFVFSFQATRVENGTIPIGVDALT